MLELELLKQIEEAIYDGDDVQVDELAQQALDGGVSPEDVIAAGVSALNRLGDEFNELRAFLPELMIAGECMKSLISRCQPYLAAGSASAFKGKVIIGTAKGDLHDIGKSLVATQLAINGYNVVDLGVDIATNKYIETAIAEKADIIAVSSLLTTSQYYMEELVNRLGQEGKRDMFRIAVGGGPIGPDYALKIGADGYSRTAALAVKMADRLMKIKPRQELIVEV